MEFCSTGLDMDEKRVVLVGSATQSLVHLRELMDQYPKVPGKLVSDIPILDAVPGLPPPAPGGPIVCVHCGRGGGTLMRVGKKGKDAHYSHKGCDNRR